MTMTGSLAEEGRYRDVSHHRDGEHHCRAQQNGKARSRIRGKKRAEECINVNYAARTCQLIQCEQFCS